AGIRDFHVTGVQTCALPISEVIVSTGYQEIPKERATGSFVYIDKKLVNRKVSTNVLERLDGVASSTLFNKGLGTGNNASFNIREIGRASSRERNTVVQGVRS